MKSKKKKVKIPRRADNGQFCTEEYAKQHPRTTIFQTIER
jgi:hypothetical protein